MALRANGFLLALFVVSTASAGGDLPGNQKARAGHDNSPAHVAAAQRIFLDPVTGRPRAPTREERQQLRQQNEVIAPSKSAELPRVVEYPDGAVGVFSKRPRNQMRAVIAGNGRIKINCKDKPTQQVKP
jgi:hypothetical protein